MLCLLSSAAGALTTASTAGRVQHGRVVAIRPAVPVDGSGHLCIGPTCAPIDHFFDGPVAPRKLRRSWAVRLAPARKVPTLAKSFVSARRHVSAMSPTRITIIGAMVNVVLAAAKIGVGIFANSACLIADGWHSFGDLCSDLLCWTCHKIGARPANARHPDGYARYEHIGTLAIAAMLASSGLVMMLRSGGAAITALRAAPALAASRAMMGTAVQWSAADVAALLVALLSVVSKELLFGATHAIGLRCRSPSIVANAYHHRSDALSSLVAIAGIGGVLCGRAWFDPLAATGVGLMVVAMGGDVAHESFEALFGKDAKESANDSHPSEYTPVAPTAELVPVTSSELGQKVAIERWLSEAP